MVILKYILKRIVRKNNGNYSFRFLIGHSTGTSSGERDFDVTLNDQALFVFHTVPQMTTGAIIQGEDKVSGTRYSFRCMAQDINKDAFGFLEIHLKKYRLENCYLEYVDSSMRVVTGSWSLCTAKDGS
ncbi:MAG: hypothetical protein U0T81_12810 [Saprospiraceae bacterium]